MLGLGFWEEDDEGGRRERRMSRAPRWCGAGESRDPISTAKRLESGRCGVSPLEGVGLHDEGVSPRGRLSPTKTINYEFPRQHRLNFFPLPHGQGSFRLVVGLLGFLLSSDIATSVGFGFMSLSI